METSPSFPQLCTYVPGKDKLVTASCGMQLGVHEAAAEVEAALAAEDYEEAAAVQQDADAAQAAVAALCSEHGLQVLHSFPHCPWACSTAVASAALQQRSCAARA